MSKVFQDLQTDSVKRGGVFVIVHLPTLHDLEGRDPFLEDWIKFVEQEALTQRIPLINAVRSFKSMPYADVIAMYNPDAGLHLSNRGNRLVADLIIDEIRRHPAIHYSGR